MHFARGWRRRIICAAWRMAGRRLRPHQDRYPTVVRGARRRTRLDSRRLLIPSRRPLLTGNGLTGPGLADPGTGCPSRRRQLADGRAVLHRARKRRFPLGDGAPHRPKTAMVTEQRRRPLWLLLRRFDHLSAGAVARIYAAAATAAGSKRGLRRTVAIGSVMPIGGFCHLGCLCDIQRSALI